MYTNVRTAYLIQFSDGTYLGTHKKPCARDGREWYKHGRKVRFEHARIFETKGGATMSLNHLGGEKAKLIEVMISEPIVINTRELEPAC